MSSRCPPQLQLTLQPNTTSFKRSFEQFGFDLPSPVEGSEGSSNDGNDRNKRARSETSFSDSTDSTDGSQASMLASASSISLSPLRTSNGISGTGLSSNTSFGPPRLPTPDIEDIQMPDYPTDDRSSEDSFSQNQTRYRLSLGSLNTLDSGNNIQPSRPSSPSYPRLPTPPPVLPPIAISEGQPRLSISSPTISFLQTPSQSVSPLADVFFDGESPSRATQSVPGESDLIQGFRARLSGALEGLVPQSPLVPGLELDDREATHTSNPHLLQESTPLEVPPEPPILPPIPSVSTSADLDHFDIQALFTGEGPVHSLSSTTVRSTSPSSVSPSLESYPLSSPILRDLPSWMDGQERPIVTGFTPTSWQPHVFDPTDPSASYNAVSSSRHRSDDEVTRVPNNSDRRHNRLVAEPTTHPSNLQQEMGLWERRLFELGNSPRGETTLSDDGSYRSISRRSSSPDLNWLDHPPRLQYAYRRRSRLGSSISLVTENSLEARRMADHDHVVRGLQPGRRRTDDIDVPRNETESPQDDTLSRLDLGRQHAPYVLHLPPLPTPSLDVAPETREGEDFRTERESGRGIGPPTWHYATHEPINHQRRQQPIRSLPESFMPSDFEPGPRNSFTFSQYSPPPRPLSPVRSSPPVAVLPSTGAFPWVPHNHRAPVGDAYNRRPHVNLTRHLAPDHRREPPPLLPQPDFGRAFVTEGQDRDIEMGIPQAPGQPHQQYHVHSEETSPSAVYPPRTHREENIQPYVHSPESFNQSRPSQFHTLLGGPPSVPFSRYQRPAVQPVQNPLELAGRPRPPPSENRRVLRFALPQPDTGRFSGSTSPVRIPERMPPLASNTDIDDRTENRASMSLQSSDRTGEPHHLSGAPILEHVDRRRDSLPTYSPATLDPAAFAPGPFRNTIHQSFYPRMNRLTPPTIPPLPFQDNVPNSHFQGDAVPVPSEETLSSRGSLSQDETAEFNYSVRNRRQGQNPEQRPRPPFMSSGAFTLNRNDGGNATGNRRRTPLHNPNLEARAETSRPADLLFPESSSNGSHRRYSLPPRNDPIRLNAAVMQRQQLIDLLHQHADGERRPGSDDPRESTHTEGPQVNGARPTSYLPPRRFGAVDLENFQSWRTRARGRFRITPGFLTAAGIRPGNIGDFIHDDDFDDSYENLINLSVTIGDVKPKSTAAEILDKLEKGLYKEWKTDDGDKRCPICLDDYTDHDTLLKLSNCNHWFHQNCLKQWLYTANTCPVCRKTVHNSESSPTSPRRPSRRFGFWRGGPPLPPGNNGNGDDPRNGNTGANNRWSSPLRRRFE